MRSVFVFVACLALASVASAAAKTPSSNNGQGTLSPQPQVIQESTVEYLPASENAAPAPTAAAAQASPQATQTEGTTKTITVTKSAPSSSGEVKATTRSSFASSSFSSSSAAPAAPAQTAGKAAESSGEVEIVDSLPKSSVRPSGSTGGNAQETPQSVAPTTIPSGSTGGNNGEEIKTQAAPVQPQGGSGHAEESAPQQSSKSESVQSEETKPQAAAPSKPHGSTGGNDEEVEDEGSDDSSDDVEGATMNDEAQAPEQEEGDDSEESLDVLQREVLGADEADPFEREVDQEAVRSDHQMEKQRQQWKDEDAQLEHTRTVSKQNEKLSDDSESARQAVKLVFQSTVNRLKKEHSDIEKDLKKSQKEDADILENLKQRLAKNMKEEEIERVAASSAAKPHPATHSHRFSGESNNATEEESDKALTPAQIDRDEAQKIHRERTVAYYDARHIRGGAIGALKRAKLSFDAAKLAWESIQEVKSEDPENFERYKKKYTVAKYNFEDATALLKKAKENVDQKGKLLKNAIAVLKDAKLKAACDDHPCTNTSTVCVPDAKHKLLRQCAHACHDFDEDACGADGHCVAINHKPVCVPVCAEDACAQETYNTRCASIKRQAVCVNPCHYFNGDEVCDKVGGLKCIPTHNATNYYIRCKDLCTDQTCAKEAVDVRCEMFKGKPVCVDPCAGVKCHGSEKCVRIREYRPDLGDRSKHNVIGVCKPLCPEDGPNPCAKFFNTTGKSRCLAVKNQRFCVDPCYNVTCPKGTQCARAGTSMDKHQCNQLCPSEPKDGEYPCPPKFAHLQQNTQCVVTDDGHHFVCKNPCKKADGHNPCPTGFKCTPNPTTPEFIRQKKYYSCAPACNIDSCKEEPLTFCRAPKHEPICTHPCGAAAKEDCYMQGPTIGCVPYVRKAEQDKPYRCVDVCQDGGPCRTRKNNTQCYRDASGQAACRDPCAKAPADICDVEQVCVPNGREPKGFKCVMACAQYPCTGKDDVCVSDNTVPIYKRRCTRYPNATL